MIQVNTWDSLASVKTLYFPSSMYQHPRKRVDKAPDCVVANSVYPDSLVDSLGVAVALPLVTTGGSEATHTPSTTHVSGKHNTVIEF